VEIYKAEGLPKPIPFSNVDGSIFVEPGRLEIYTRMQTDRFKVFSNLADWWEEWRRYHRIKGKIVKENDDLMDGTRYAACMVQRFGVDNRPRISRPVNQMSAAF
jgi:hypothetical protein